MGRISGARNKDHDDTRNALIDQLTPAVLLDYARSRSLRDLALAIGVDGGTLRHYFKTRAGLVGAVFQRMLPIGEMRRQAALTLLVLPVAQALTTLLKQIAEAWPILGALHSLGFAEGFASTDVGLIYIRDIFEPTLAVFEQMLAHYDSIGELRVPDTRVAGLGLLAPVLLGLFHQHQLQGTRCRALDVDAFIDAHVAAFLRGYRKE